MLLVDCDILWLTVRAPDLRIAGTVTDARDNPLVRRVALYDSAGNIIAETWSDAAGYAEFIVSGKNGNDRFTAHAFGLQDECDDISCPIRGTAVTA